MADLPNLLCGLLTFGVTAHLAMHACPLWHRLPLSLLSCPAPNAAAHDMRSSPDRPSRIVNVSSAAHFFGHMDFDDLQVGHWA